MSKFVILHKRKTPRFHVLYNESAKTNICNIYERRCLSQILYIIPHSYTNQFKKIKLMQILFEPSNKPSLSILISIFILGYHGKTTDFAKNSSCHRTTIAHFLNSGKWMIHYFQIR